MAIVVQKFGGTSVADVDRMKTVAKIIVSEADAGNQVVVAVSAMGKTTDKLVDMVAEITDKPDPREMDMLLTTGEQVSISLLTMVLQSMGRKAVSMTGPQVGIETDEVHGKARIKSIDSDCLSQALNDGNIVIVAGFQGKTCEGQITTLGRGGSDTTAVALAAALNADRCDIYTDVDGVYTTDPRVCRDARKLDFITYDEMLELASLGAGVLHSRSVEMAKNYNVALQVRSSFTNNPGTMVVKEYEGMEDIVVSGVAFNRNESKITIVGVPDQPGMAADLFGTLGEKAIEVDMIIQNLSDGQKNNISFTVAVSDFDRACQVAEDWSKSKGGGGIVTDDNVGKVSIVGVGMKSHSGVAAKMFRALANENINISMISTSEIKISVLINKDELDRAVQAIHGAFELAQA